MKTLLVNLLLLVCFFPLYALGECLKGDCMNGEGAETYPGGHKYIGEFKNGKPNGQGTFTLHDGTKYVGQWKNGKYNGQGILTFFDGRQYVGDFKNSKYKKRVGCVVIDML